VSSGNSGPPHSGNSEPSSDSHKRQNSSCAYPPVHGPAVAEGEEDVEHVKASRSGDFIEGGPRQDGGGPVNRSVAVLGKVTTMGRLLSQSLTPLRGEK